MAELGCATLFPYGVFTEHADCAGLCLLKYGRNFSNIAFAAAVRPNQSYKHTCFDLERDVFECRRVAIAKGDIRKRYNCTHKVSLVKVRQSPTCAAQRRLPRYTMNHRGAQQRPTNRNFTKHCPSQ